ncbi:MAG TPA: hypothetical protein DCO77_08570 [Nitrospiraceae bacterium]|nr:hypothetical protein [Nitrospiraceae bacterium]
MKKYSSSMNVRTFTLGVVVAALAFGLFPSLSEASEFRIVIMQDKKGAAKKYRPLVPYFNKKGIDIAFVGASSYTVAAKMFASGKADAMFSGSGVAGTMIIKGVAYPAVRPLAKDGSSTYWAVVLAPKGSARYTGSSAYFRGKTAIFCSLASSGEFYFRSVGGHKTAKSMKKAASHGDAIDALARGVADVAIVKNRVWDSMRKKYRGLEVVGSDLGENPNGTLIISKKVNLKLTRKVTSLFLNITTDSTSEAQKMREKMKIIGYLRTTRKNFSHTLSLLKQAGVNKKFNFAF